MDFGRRAAPFCAASSSRAPRWNGLRVASFRAFPWQKTWFGPMTLNTLERGNLFNESLKLQRDWSSQTSPSWTPSVLQPLSDRLQRTLRLEENTPAPPHPLLHSHYGHLTLHAHTLQTVFLPPTTTPNVKQSPLFCAKSHYYSVRES